MTPPLEEQLRHAIDQLRNREQPCREHSIALTHLETALLWVLVKKVSG